MFYINEMVEKGILNKCHPEFDLDGEKPLGRLKNPQPSEITECQICGAPIQENRYHYIEKEDLILCRLCEQYGPGLGWVGQEWFLMQQYFCIKCDRELNFWKARNVFRRAPQISSFPFLKRMEVPLGKSCPYCDRPWHVKALLWLEWYKGRLEDGDSMVPPRVYDEKKESWKQECWRLDQEFFPKPEPEKESFLKSFLKRIIKKMR